MNNSTVRFLAASTWISTLLFCPGAFAEVGLTVYPDAVVRVNAASATGVVLNQAADGRLSLESLTQAIRQSGTKHLRFPEGESADNYSFTDPRLVSDPDPSTHRLANNAWWPAGTSLARADGTLIDGLDFDAFMSVVRATGAAANVVLCYPCGDKAAALEMAKAWVRYSRDRGYGVLDWEIGNESYLFNPEYTDDHRVTVEEYAKDIIEWSAALKEIDPRIRIGVNGFYKHWFQTLLTFRHPWLGRTGAQAIDFFSVHDYPKHGASFADYQGAGNWRDLTIYIREAIAAITDSAGIVPVSHVRIAVTETSSMNFTPNAPNDLGSAIMTADLLGALLQYPLVEYVELWASHWTVSGTLETSRGPTSSRPGTN